MRIEAAVEQFLQYLTLERGCTSATISAYTSDIRQLVAHLESNGIEPDLQAVTPIVLRRYVSRLVSEGYSPSTTARRIHAISSLFRYLVGHGHADTNPCASVVLPKKQHRTPAVLTAEEARRVLRASEDHAKAPTAFRNRAIIATLLFCGLRRAELVDLQVGDVDLRSGWLKVRNGKGGKQRSVPLVGEVLSALADWLEFRPDVDHDYLFTGFTGRRLGNNGVACIFKQVAKKAGVLRDGVSLHTLRHTFASLLLQEGCDLVAIKELLGHADLSSTAIYLHMDASHLKAAVQRHPLRH